jgi:methyl-accepting chemotaxis protein
MKNYSLLAMLGILVSGVVLSADALYFDSMNMYLSNALVFMALMACSGYLLKLVHDGNKTVDSSFEKTSAFHVQLGTEIAGQLSSAHTELSNTQAILSDAIGKLVSNFILISDGVRDLSEHTHDFSKQIHDVVEKTGSSLSVAEQTLSKLAADDKAAAMLSIQHVRTIMADLAAFNDAVAKNAIDLNFISTNVEQNVLVVISTLQFQDMSSQLIEHARMRMTALQEVANEMGKNKGTSGRPTRSEYLEQIAAYNQLLDKHVVSLDKQKANPVGQRDFGTGDIELF